MSVEQQKAESVGVSPDSAHWKESAEEVQRSTEGGQEKLLVSAKWRRQKS